MININHLQYSSETEKTGKNKKKLEHLWSEWLNTLFFIQDMLSILTYRKGFGRSWKSNKRENKIEGNPHSAVMIA